MNATCAPRGPDLDNYPQVKLDVSFPPQGGDCTMQSKLDNLIDFIVNQYPTTMPLGGFEAYRAELEGMNKEVRYCLWAMNVSIGVYMKLLYLVDIEVRQEISDKVGDFLASWKNDKGPALSDAMDVLIISEFTKHSIPTIPDMASLEQNKHCDSILSTVANYIKDLALKIDNVRHLDIEVVIAILFPLSEKFIGRCFFPRLAVVSSRLLEMIKEACQ